MVQHIFLANTWVDQFIANVCTKKTGPQNPIKQTPITETEKVNSQSKLKDQHTLIQSMAQILRFQVYNTELCQQMLQKHYAAGQKLGYLMLQNKGKCDNCLKTICLLWSATFHVRQHANRQNLYLRFWKPLFFLRNMKHSTRKEMYGVCHTTWNAHWSFVLHGRHHQYLLLQFAETACSLTHDKY
jgi:hypothetical protein